MHTISLGADAYLLGNVFTYMAQVVLPSSADANMAVMWDSQWESIQHFYNTHSTPCRMSRLSMAMMKHESFPRLSAKLLRPC